MSLVPSLFEIVTDRSEQYRIPIQKLIWIVSIVILVVSAVHFLILRGNCKIQRSVGLEMVR